MANGNPQVEDGYTRIANELFEAMMRAPLIGAEHRVLMGIIRLTYGYNRKVDAISVSQIMGATGVPRRTVIRAMHNLIRKNIITSVSRPGQPALVGVQKRYQDWQFDNAEPDQNTTTEDATHATDGTSATPDTSATDGIGTHATDGTPTHATRGTHQRQLKTEKDIEGANAPSAARPASGRNAVRAEMQAVFCDVTKLPAPATKTEKQRRAAGATWFEPLREIAELAGWDAVRGARLIRETCEHMMADGLTIASPKSIVRVATARYAEGQRPPVFANADPPQVVLTGTDSGFAYGEIERIQEQMRLEREAATCKV